MSSAGVAQRADADLVTGRLREFKLTTAAEEMVPRLTQRDLAAALPVVGEVLDAEAEARHERRVTRLRRTSKLPATKTFGSFDMNRIPAALRQKIATLRDGAFLAEATNVLAFGLPGTGKSHALAALGHELVLAGHSVLFVPTYEIVQQLLAAKRDLELPRKLHRLDQFELIILDDIGYVQQSAEEAEVLFTLLAERYERQSIALTSNLVFSDWDRVFKNKMATTAAIDRLVHHSAILEFDVTSFRSATPTTKKRKGEAKT